MAINIAFTTPGNVIDGKYEVIGIFSTDGGMGKILKVREATRAGELALKFCLSDEDALKDRFRREIRLMLDFQGNSRVVQILDSNLSHDPPYFVMPIYELGDLRTLTPAIKSNLELQEETLLEMANCVEQLHIKGKFHRDLKPANFLRGQNGIVVSDLGLGYDLFSETGNTSSSEVWGTFSYCPPEFFSGGFKNSDARADIFMLGKAFYNVLTGNDPTFLDKDSLGKSIFLLIDRCCRQNPDERYSSIPHLKDGITQAYDFLLGRLEPGSQTRAIYDKILDLIKVQQFDAEQVIKFLDSATALDSSELFEVVRDANRDFFFVLSQKQFEDKLGNFLDAYASAIFGASNLEFSYAELVADVMEVIFKNSEKPSSRIKALEIAIKMAERLNRFAAMSTCSEMISKTQSGDPVEPEIIDFLQHNPAQFLRGIEATECRSPAIASQIRRMKSQTSEV